MPVWHWVQRFHSTNVIKMCQVYIILPIAVNIKRKALRGSLLCDTAARQEPPMVFLFNISSTVSFFHSYDPDQQHWETSFQHHYTHWWRCNISSGHLPSLPVCRLHPRLISGRWGKSAHLCYISTRALSGKRNRTLSVQHVFPFFFCSIHLQVQYQTLGRAEKLPEVKH